MDQGETEQLIRDALSNHSSSASLRDRLKGQSARAFARGRTLRLWHRRAAAICVVTLTAAGAFLVGRCTPAGRPLDERTVQGERVVVSRDLVTWLEAGRFFAQLGMPEREARAYQQASRLAAMPDPVTSAGRTDTSLGQLLARCDAAVAEGRKSEGGNRIMAQVSGGFNYDR
jgi:hypothetical protein